MFHVIWERVNARLPPAGSNTTSAFRGVMVLAFVSSIGWSTYDRFLPVYLKESGASVAYIGFFFGTLQLLGSFAGVLGGVLADTLGKRFTLSLGRFLRTVGWVLILALVRKPEFFFIPVLLMGVGAMAGSPYRALVAENAPNGQVATAFALTGAISNLVPAIAAPIIGLACDRYGLDTVLFAVALFSLLEHISIIGLRSETSSASGTRPSWNDGFRFMLTLEGRGAMVMALVWVVTGFSLGMAAPLWVIYARDRFGLDYLAVGGLATTIALGHSLGQVFGGRLADMFGRAKVMVVTLFLTLPLWGGVPFIKSPVVLMVMAGVIGLIDWASAPSWESVGVLAVPARVRASAVGVFSGAQALGAAMGSSAFGLLYSLNINAPFYAILPVHITMAAMIIYAMRRRLAGFSDTTSMPASQRVS